MRRETAMRLGKVVKSNSHCDYVVQLDDRHEVTHPPLPDDYGFGCFVKLEEPDERHWAVGLVYNSQLFNPMFLSNGPRLSSEPDPMFTPDLVADTRTLLGVVLIGTLIEGDPAGLRASVPDRSLRAAAKGGSPYGYHGIPKVIVPINTPAFVMTKQEIYHFHCNENGNSQFCYYSHLLRCGGTFASQLTQQVLKELVDGGLFAGAEKRALEILCKELSWKNTMAAMR